MIEVGRESERGTSFVSPSAGGYYMQNPGRTWAINRAIGQGLSNYKHLAQSVGGLLA